MTQRFIACTTCRHFTQGSIKETGRARCDAFPDGIPLLIIQGLVTHRLPIEGDRGIQWSPLPGQEDAMKGFPDPATEPFKRTALGN
jgi:hypothetical protein